MRESYGCGLKTSISEADPGEGTNGQTEETDKRTNGGPKGRKTFFLKPPPIPLSQGLVNHPPPPPPLSEGLDLTPEPQIGTSCS